MCHAMTNPHTDILESSLPLVVLESIPEIVARMSKNWPVIIIMTVKGNLRHRIVKLGSERLLDDLTPEQLQLRYVALQQKCRDVISGHAERPTWGGGAFFYCETGHLHLVRETMHRLPFDLQSKHIVCSPAYEAIVRECIAAATPGLPPGREGFLIKRSGQIRQYDVVELPACPKLGVDDLYRGQFDVDLIQHLASSAVFESAYPDT